MPIPEWNDPGARDRHHSDRRSQQGTVKVRIGIDQKDARILPDMGVRVSFLERRRSPAGCGRGARGVLVPASGDRRA